MSDLGKLSVSLGIDTSEFSKGMKEASSNFASSVKGMTNNVVSSFDSASDGAEKSFSESIGKMSKDVAEMTKTVQRHASQAANALANIIPPGGIIPPEIDFSKFAPDSGSIIKSIAQIAEYVSMLKSIGIISDDVASKMMGFSQAIYDMGYSVDTILPMLQKILQMFMAMQTASQGAGGVFNTLSEGINRFAAGMQSGVKMITDGGQKLLTEGVGGYGALVPVWSSMGDASTRFASKTSFATRNAKEAWAKFYSGIKGGYSSFMKQVDSMARKTDQFSKDASKNFKDITRIAQGIIVAQAFYKVTNAIQGSISALAEFSSLMETSTAAFGVMFGDTAKAERFMRVLQDFAADTPYNLEQAATNARKLLAYGFDPGSVKPIMTILSDASAASGDEQTFSRIAVALGQIRTKGRLATQELLQLTEAGIPAFDILQEKLGLTKEQIADIGNQGISAGVAIQAILAGMQERYAGAGEVISNTMKGMLNTIKDNALIIGSEAFGPLYDSFKGVVKRIRDATDELRTIVRTSGLGGLVRALFPPSVVASLQLLIANVKALMASFRNLWVALGPFRQVMGELALLAANTFIPMFTAMIQVITWFTHIVLNSAPQVRILVGAILGLIVAGYVTKHVLLLGAAIRRLFIVKAISQLIIYLAKAIKVLSAAMITNPWIAALGIATGALLYFGLTSQKVKGWLGGLGGMFTKAFGYDPSKELVPKMEDNVDITDEFNQSLSDTSEGFDDMGDSAKKAAKKAKESLLSFDEVFNLTEDMDENGTGDLDFSVGDIAVPEIPEISLPEVEMPNYTESVQGWVNQFTSFLRENLANALIGASLGAVIGAVVGGILGGPSGAILGAKIGGLAGGIAGMFWNMLPEKFKDAAKGAGIAAAVGAVIGALLGGPGGALIGAGIGTVVGGIAGWFKNELAAEANWDTMGIGVGVGTVIGGILGMVLGGPGGAAIGVGIGTLVGGIVGTFWDSLVNFFTSSAAGGGLGIGTVLGGIIGTCFGGPAGALIGAGIGALVGWIVGKFIDADWSAVGDAFLQPWRELGDALVGYFQKIWEPISQAWKDHDWLALGGYLVLGIIEGILGAIVAVFAAIGTFFVSVWEAFCEIFGIHSPAKEMEPIGEFIILGIVEGLFSAVGTMLTAIGTIGAKFISKVADWFSSISDNVEQWSADTMNTIKDWSSETKDKIVTWTSDRAADFKTWWSNTSDGFSTWKDNVATTTAEWASNTKGTLSTWATNTKQTVSTWWRDTKTNFSDGWSNLKSGTKDWISDNAGKLGGWATNAKGTVSNWWSDTKSGFSSWWGENKTGFSSWTSETSSKLSTWGSNTKSSFSNWWNETRNGLSSWSTNTKGQFQGWVSNTSGKLSRWFSNTKSGFSGWRSEVAGKVSSWASNTRSTFSTWTSNVTTTFSGWWTSSKTGFTNWAKDVFNGVLGWFDKLSEKLSSFFEKLKFWKKDAEDAPDVSYTATITRGSMYNTDLSGHATGGIFNREHVARFAEGNKAEAIIPLQNAGAMQPFVDAVAAGLETSLRNTGVSSTQMVQEPTLDDRPILYVGTLIADDRSLRELERKMQVIKQGENRRRG